MAKVSKRGGFSDRNGIKKINTEIQIKEFDERSRIQLQNMVNRMYSRVYSIVGISDYSIQDFFKFVLGEIYSEPIFEGILYNESIVIGKINDTIRKDEYDDVLTLIEALLQYWDAYLIRVMGENYTINYDNDYREESVYEIANKIFQKEYIGYRFIGGMITPITDDYEVKTLNESLASDCFVVREHFQKANRYLSDRKQPDYENSIKESISAVEAMCKKITNASGQEATLGKMLKKLEDNGVEIHSGLKAAFKTLYGYTSDANGIRHAGDIGGSASTFEEAKFMLVSCSAFVNYLIGVMAD